jgi:peptidoglycan/xylan/chitin deacetylase (PgdA/CDA1 family)
MKRSEFLQSIGLGFGAYALLGRTAAGQESLQGEYELNAHFVHSGPGLGNRVSLTYDDGPSPGVTERVLKELDKHKITATFFMIGKKVEAYPALAREVAAAGHELANHTYTHPYLSKYSATRVRDELTRCQEAIAEVTGVTPVWFRPPYGAFRTNQGSLAREQDLGVAYWSIDPRDWSRPGASTIVSRIVSSARPGAIILLHDLHRQTADATGPLLEQLCEKSYQFSPISGFLGDPYGRHYQES